ncbi:Serine dehydrogenase proteinase [Nitrosomonas nitrosa]|uniref:Serine dehydrogenase proteinase n=1 Tax=Nitrosomonas nitrosa TaxID=52442 RepID=A0A1I4SSF2_9PROT|nr:serine protease [Nitrosomonas nitrosa]CAE6495503.1 Serine dehydrogenase proteinase [Nitrosomonas nitrosa]SFM67309.1 Serine dehydrogenase proteinase [Nitrosomonas nitrosa]
MYQDRRNLYQQLENLRSSKILVYVTGDRPGLETQIHSEVFDFFVNHLDRIGVTEKISLYLYTRGGSTLTAWSLINLIRQFCDDLEIIIPSKCHSAGTIMSLGANRIVMTKQATLGPIDPSVNTPLNPQIEGAPPTAKVPVSVEAIKGYIELVKEELGVKGDESLARILVALSEKVHPLVLGEVYRSRSQIKMLAKRLLANQITDAEKVEKIVNFLCSDSGSHDYTINRREAKNELGLVIDKPNDDLYAIIKKIYDDIQQELCLTDAYDPNSILSGNRNTPYSFKRGLVESYNGGSNHFCSEGQFIRVDIPGPAGMQPGIQDNRTFEGWKYEPAN